MSDKQNLEISTRGRTALELEDCYTADQDGPESFGEGYFIHVNNHNLGSPYWPEYRTYTELKLDHPEGSEDFYTSRAKLKARRQKQSAAANALPASPSLSSSSSKASTSTPSNLLSLSELLSSSLVLSSSSSPSWIDLPLDIFTLICTYLNPQTLCRLSRVCKRWATTPRSNQVWKSLVEHLWPMANTNISMKSWLQYYKSRHETIKKFHLRATKAIDREHQADLNIENCAQFVYECPKRWSQLRGYEVRFCDTCNKDVYLVASVAELNEHVQAGHCIAVGTVSEYLEAEPQVGFFIAPPNEPSPDA